MSKKNNFNKYELFNIQLDVWIDEEDYQKLDDDCIELGNLKSKIDDFLKNKPSKKSFNEFLTKKSPIKSIKINESKKEVINDWQSLFWAKYLRARIMENGTDTYMVLLDDLIIYLQRNLPYQSPVNEEEFLLQHLYLQELSACGKPGLESLGFALQAYDLIANRKKTSGQGKHFNFELYKLWAKLNQGIGYWHSQQRTQASSAFNEIIRDFDKQVTSVENGRVKSLWRSLIFDQAVLFMAELQEDLQFSYHTLKTLNLLNDRKKERKLIKEALAYRDMCRLKDAKNKMKELWGKFESVVEAFKTYEDWRKRIKKRNIESQAFGLLIDFYLMKFEEEKGKENQDNEVLEFINKLKEYIKNLPKFLKDSKKERMSFYCQIARFLKWLGDNKTEQAEKLYHEFRETLKDIELKEFGKYEYDRFTDSMEKFYEKINKDGNNPFKG